MKTRTIDEWGYGKDVVSDERFILYPLGKEAAQLKPFEPSETDVLLIENAYAAVYAVGFVDTPIDPYYKYGVSLVFVNKTEQHPISFKLKNVDMDEMENVYSYLSVDVAPQSYTRHDLQWSGDKAPDDPKEIIMTFEGRDSAGALLFEQKGNGYKVNQ